MKVLISNGGRIGGVSAADQAFLDEVILPVATKVITGGRKAFVEDLRSWSNNHIRHFEEFKPVRALGPAMWREWYRRMAQAADIAVIMPSGRAGSAIYDAAREEGIITIDLRAPDVLRLAKGWDHLLAARLDPMSPRARRLAQIWLSFDTPAMV